TGLLAGIQAARFAESVNPLPPPRETALGSLVNYICHADVKNFQPANITFDLLPQLDEATRRKVRDKKLRHKMVCEMALEHVTSWLHQIGSSTFPLKGSATETYASTFGS